MEPLTVTTPRRLVGPLRVMHHPEARTHGYADDSGARRILFCSWFCALRDWKDNRTYAETLLDAIAAAGYQGIRIFRVLGFDWRAGGGYVDDGYYAGRGVSPEWGPDVLVEFARACQTRGLRLALSAGHQPKDARVDTLAFTRRWTTAIHAADLDATIALVEGDNEYWQNAPLRDSDEQIAIYRDEFAIVRSTLSPAPLCACGAPEDESPHRLYRAASHSDLCELHGKRDQDIALKRAHGKWYWEGDPGHFPLPFWEGEPLPPPGPDAFMPCDSPGRITAVLAVTNLTGGAVTYFCGQSVRTKQPIEDSPGFKELPGLLEHLPEDVATWTHEAGGHIWWWRGPNNQCATVVDEQWGPGAYEPPRPLADWKVIGPGWTVTDGDPSKPFALPAGFGGALIVGHFQ